MAFQSGMSAKELRESGFNLNASDEFDDRPIHIAVRTRDKSGTKALIEAGANLKVVNKAQRTPLHIAVIAFQDKDIIKSLISQEGENIKMKDSDGYTPLDYAKYRKNQAAIDAFETFEKGV